MKRRRHIAFLTCCAVTAALSVGGCDSGVPPPAGLEEPFSMFGVLNPTLNTQTLLVSPIDDLLEPLGESIDAVVTSTDVGSGEVVAWRDSVVMNETGQIDHIFVADFQPAFGSRHRIEVARSDGERSIVEVDVPGPVAVEQVDTGTRYQLVTIKGENVRLVRFEITYGVRLYDAKVDTMGPVSSYSFARTGEAYRGGAGWRIDLNMDEDYALAKSAYQGDHEEAFERFSEAPECTGLGLLELKASLTVGNADWPLSQGDPNDASGPAYRGNPNVTAYASTATNVENGFGFVAGGYDRELSLSPSPDALRDTWFLDLLGGKQPEAIGCE